MANLLRLVVALLVVCWGQAWALAPVDAYYVTNDPTRRYTTAEAACSAWGSSQGLVPPVLVFQDGSCGMYYASGGFYPMNWKKERGGMCPANSVLSGSSCTCDPGYKESGSQCVYESTGNSCAGLSDFCSGLKGEKINLEGKGTATPPGCSADSQRPNCAMGCAAEAVGMGVSYKTPDGSWMTGQEYRVTGGTCTLPAPSDVPQKKESDCAGSVGEINGVRTCVPNQAATGDTTSKETKNGDGTTSNTESKTTCENGVCKTTSTTTTKDSSGNTTSTSTSSSSSSQREYCATNKASTVCAATNGDKNPDSKDGTDKGEACEGDDCEGKPGKFEGSCMAGFVCEGDALQCAIAKDQHRRNCQMFDDKTSESQLYDSEVAKGSNRDVTKDLPGNTEVDVSGKLSSEDVLGGGRCIADLSVQVWRSSVTLPFSNICPSLGYLGWVLVAVCSLAAFRIVSGPSKED